MKLKEKIELYHALYAFLKTDGIQHLEEKTVHFEDTKKLILNLPDPIVSKIDEHFIVSFAWEILEGYLEKLYWLVYNSKPLHIYGRLLLGKDEAIYVENIKPEIDRYLKEEDINYVRVHHSNYAKYTLKSSRSNKVITHTDTGLELSFVMFDKKETNPVIYPLNRDAHVIVGADDNKQLNDVTETMMKSIHKNYKAQEVQFVIASKYPKQFDEYKSFMYRDLKVIKDVNELLIALSDLEKVMLERFKVFELHKARDLKMFNFYQTNVLEKLPYILVVIDDIEIDDSSIKEKYNDLVLRVIQRSRASGIHFIMLTTNPYKNISNQFAYFIPNRLAFRLYQSQDSMALLGTKDACNLRSNEYLCKTYHHIQKK